MIKTFVRAALDEQNTMKKAIVDSVSYIGCVIWCAGNVTPDNTIYCDGSAVSRTTYSELFDAIGTTYGAGDGSSTFNVPDLRNVWAVGAGTSAVGTDVAEGLPNLIGETIFRKVAEDATAGQVLDVIGGASGVFAMVGTVAHNFDRYIGYGDNTTEGYAGLRFVFNAQTYNSIYGAQTHVTPASVALTPCIIYE